jgi:hypothetical protein
LDNDIFIRYKCNSQINDSGFKVELEKNYKVQTKPIYIPSATEGGEMWFQIFLNIDFKSFILGAVASGLAWDLIKIGTKNYFLKPLLSAIDSLIKQNTDNSSIDFKRIEFEFDDVTIRIIGIKSQHFIKSKAIFSKIFEIVPKLENNDLGILSDIVLPYIQTDSEYKPFTIIDENEDLPLSEYLKYWLIEYNLGLDRYFYDIEKHEIIK